MARTSSSGYPNVYKISDRSYLAKKMIDGEIRTFGTARTAEEAYQLVVRAGFAEDPDAYSQTVRTLALITGLAHDDIDCLIDSLDIAGLALVKVAPDPDLEAYLDLSHWDAVLSIVKTQ